MWDDYGIYFILALTVIIALLTMKYWGAVFYGFTRHWQMACFVTVLSLLGALVVVKQESLKYELAYYYYTGSKNASAEDTKYKIRQCRNFIEAKLNGEHVNDVRPVKAGFINITTINNWDFCAKTFGLNYWKYDTSVNGIDGGQALCSAYEQSSYRSGKVQGWCNTVFAPNHNQEQKI